MKMKPTKLKQNIKSKYSKDITSEDIVKAIVKSINRYNVPLN